MDSDISTLLDVRILEKSKESEKSYIFLHSSIQEVCAAIFYMLKRHVEHPSQDVKNIETVLFMFLKKVKTQWIFFSLMHSGFFFSVS